MKKLFEEGTISGNGSGQGGGASLPFNKGYFQSGNSGEPGITFTPTGERRSKKYKEEISSRKKMKERQKKKALMKKFKEFKENVSQPNVDNTTTPPGYYDKDIKNISNMIDNDYPLSDVGDAFYALKKKAEKEEGKPIYQTHIIDQYEELGRKAKEHFKNIKENATSTLGNTGGVGGVVAANPSSTPGDVAGSSIGSGDVGQTLGTYTKTGVKMKKKKKKNKREKIKSFESFK